jgi:hypothetical protein
MAGNNLRFETMKNIMGVVIVLLVLGCGFLAMLWQDAEERGKFPKPFLTTEEFKPVRLGDVSAPVQFVAQPSRDQQWLQWGLGWSNEWVRATNKIAWAKWEAGESLARFANEGLEFARKCDSLTSQYNALEGRHTLLLSNYVELWDKFGVLCLLSRDADRLREMERAGQIIEEEFHAKKKFERRMEELQRQSSERFKEIERPIDRIGR